MLLLVISLLTVSCASTSADVSSHNQNVIETKKVEVLNYRPKNIIDEEVRRAAREIADITIDHLLEIKKTITVEYKETCYKSLICINRILKIFDNKSEVLNEEMRLNIKKWHDVFYKQAYEICHNSTTTTLERIFSHIFKKKEESDSIKTCSLIATLLGFYRTDDRIIVNFILIAVINYKQDNIIPSCDHSRCKKEVKSIIGILGNICSKDSHKVDISSDIDHLRSVLAKYFVLNKNWEVVGKTEHDK